MTRNNKTRGIYTFANGYTMYVNGMSAIEKRNYIRMYGVIVKFESIE